MCIRDRIKESEAPVTKISDAKITEDDFESPIMTHTMVDIYMTQKHYDKALELLDKILEIDPNDEKSMKKKLKIQGLLSKNTSSVDEDLFDKKKSQYKKIETAYLKFHEKILEKSKS